MESNLLEIIESSKDNILIIGKAGVGKSTLIKVLKKSLGKKCVIVCPTGIAAQNVKGQTINSFFKIPPRNEMKPWEIDSSGEKLAELLNTEMQELNTIIIDEISMVNQFVLEFISSILKKAKNNYLPFGGIRMILIGDLFQLPPIDKGNIIGDTIFFWHSSSYKISKFETLELSQVHRQINNTENAQFIDALNRIRLYQIEQYDLNLINERLSFEVDSFKTTILTSRNAIAARYNEIGLNKLKGRAFEFEAIVTGKWSKNDFPKDTTFQLKVGVPVLFIKNDPSGEYKNGTRGIITEINQPEKKLKVKISFDKSIDVEYVSWAHPKYNRASQDETIVVRDTFKHFPLILGFALTIHRCQGMTLDSIHLDLGTGAFAPGQLYVALSRIRNFSKLSIGRKINKSDVVSSPEIESFYKKLNPKNVELVLSSSDINNINIENGEIIESNGKRISSSEISRILFRKGCEIEDIQQERSRLGFKEVLPETIIGHIISNYAEFSKDELDKIIPISKELEESVVFQLKSMEICEQTKLSEIKNRLIEKDIHWNVLRLIGIRNNCFLGEETQKTKKKDESKIKIITQKNLPHDAKPLGFCKKCNKQLQGDKTKLLCYDCYKKLPKKNQSVITSANAYKPWSEADDKKLLELHKAGNTNTKIAKDFNRTSGAIQKRLKKLNG